VLTGFLRPVNRMRKNWNDSLKVNSNELKEAVKLLKENRILLELWRSSIKYFLGRESEENLKTLVIEASKFEAFKNAKDKIIKAFNKRSNKFVTYIVIKINLCLSEYAKKLKLKKAKSFFEKSAYNVYLLNLTNTQIKAQLNLVEKLLNNVNLNLE